MVLLQIRQTTIYTFYWIKTDILFKKKNEQFCCDRINKNLLNLQVSDADILTLNLRSRYRERYHYPNAIVQKRLHAEYFKII